MPPRGFERAANERVIRVSEPNVRDAAIAPLAGDRQKHIGALGHERLPLLGREHHVAVASFHRRERGEDAAADAKIDRAHVRSLFGASEGEREAFEGGNGTHGGQSL